MESNLDTNNILFLPLNGEICVNITQELIRAGIETREVLTTQKAKEEMISNNYKVLLIRCDTVNEETYSLIQFKKAHQINVAIIVSVRNGMVEDAVRCIKEGVDEFIVNDCYDARLVEMLFKTAMNCQIGHHLQNVANKNNPNESENILIGQSQAICEIRSAVNLIAKSQATVLLTGESGTGKEVIARLIHAQSHRSQKQFIALNCATLPKDIIENELFGHEKGAFTGALQKKIGCFELANGGTLLFDEIAEMTLETQAKLLRAIETHKFRRLGGSEEVYVDVRMIAATNKPITSALQSKELREDLYYRLSVIEIYIPPLRERKEDIPLLVEYFLSMFTRKYEKSFQEFSDESLEILYAYSWPGNIRELRNVIERAIVISHDNVIGTHYLPTRIKEQIPTHENINIPLGCSAQEAEKIVIIRTLASTGNNKAKTARILGVSRKTLHNKLLSFQQLSADDQE
jgi:DNA-binding NtrC family response regulator